EHVVAHWFSTPVWLWCRWAGSDALDDGGDAHAAADAERDESALAAGALEFVEDRAGDHRAGRAERMAHGDGAAVDVELLVRDVHVLLETQDDRGERLVELPEVDVVGGETGGGQRLLGGRGGAGQHDGGVGAGGGGGDDAGAGRHVHGPAGLFRSDDDERRAIDDAGRVATVVDVVDLLDPVVLLQCHGIEATHVADHGERG